jgi:hypothetical protein
LKLDLAGLAFGLAPRWGSFFGTERIGKTANRAMGLSSEPITLRHNRARLLFRHWQREEHEEGYVREFSPDGAYVRISHTPDVADKGGWLKAADFRVLEVLEAAFDFKTWNENKRRRRQRSREGDVSGDEWKHGDDAEGAGA